METAGKVLIGVGSVLGFFWVLDKFRNPPSEVDDLFGRVSSYGSGEADIAVLKASLIRNPVSRGFAVNFEVVSTHKAIITVKNPTIRDLTYSMRFYVQTATAANKTDGTPVAEAGITVSGSDAVITFPAGATKTVSYNLTMPNVEGAFKAYLDVYYASAIIKRYESTEPVILVFTPRVSAPEAVTGISQYYDYNQVLAATTKFKNDATRSITGQVVVVVESATTSKMSAPVTVILAAGTLVAASASTPLNIPDGNYSTKMQFYLDGSFNAGVLIAGKTPLATAQGPQVQVVNPAADIVGTSWDTPSPPPTTQYTPPPPTTQYTLTVSVPTTGNLLGGSNPGPGTYSYAAGLVITLQAFAGYEAYEGDNWAQDTPSGWYVDGVFVAGAVQNITMNANHTAKPVFIGTQS